MHARAECPEERITLRLPGGVHSALKASAAANSRSMNAEIIHRLKQEGPAEGASSPSHGSDSPSEEIGMNRQTDTTPKAAAASAEKVSLLRLGDPIAESFEFARLANYVADQCLSQGLKDDSGDSVRLMTWEIDVVLFAALQAQLAASRAHDAYCAAVEQTR